MQDIRRKADPELGKASVRNAIAACCARILSYLAKETSWHPDPDRYARALKDRDNLLRELDELAAMSENERRAWHERCRKEIGWRTAEEIAAGTDTKDAAARSHAKLLANAGLMDVLKGLPTERHHYRLSKRAARVLGPDGAVDLGSLAALIATGLRTGPAFASWEDYLARTSEHEREARCRAIAYQANKRRSDGRRPAIRLTWKDVWAVLQQAQGRCCHCGSLALDRMPTTACGSVASWRRAGSRIGSLDHRDGGCENEPANLAWACLACNTSRGGKIVSRDVV